MATAASHAPADPRHYVWWFPGSPLKVHLELDVVRKLQRALQDIPQGQAIQGLLYGRVHDGATEILHVQPCVERIQDAAASAPERYGEYGLVGYYRTEKGALRTNEEDRALAESAFRKPYQVFLLIQPASFGPPNAAFFFHSGNHRISEVALLDFPLDASLLAREERERIARSQQATAEKPPPIELVATSAPKSPLPPRVVLPKLTAALLLIACGAAISVGYFSLRNRFSRTPENRSLTDVPVQSLTVSPSPVAGENLLGLHAARQNGDVEFTWNRQSAAVSDASWGMISIEDGSSTRQIPLTPARLRAGSVLYSPVSDQILMELAVNHPAGVVTQSVMVVLSKANGTRTYPLQISRVPPAAQALPPQTAPDSVTLAKSSKPFTVPESSPPPKAQVPLPPDESLAPKNSLAAAIPPAPVAVLPPMPLPQRMPSTLAPRPAPEGMLAPPPETATVPATYQPPEPRNKVTPRFPSALRPLVSKPVTVEIRIAIDANGKVTKAEPVSTEGLHKFFLDEAIAAARYWTFKPARRGNQTIPSESILRFVFSQ